MKKIILPIVLIVLLIVSIGTSIFFYVKAQSLETSLQNRIERSSHTLRYLHTIQHILERNTNNTFAPPVPLVNALLKAFDISEWTDDVLMQFNATTVDARIVYGYVDQPTNTTIVVDALQAPVNDYANFVVDGMPYRYMWQIVAYNQASDLMPMSHEGYVLIDAVTGEFLPISPT